MKTRPRIGVLALANRDSGGVFQYTQAVIDALAGRPDFEPVLFSPHREYDARNLEAHAVCTERGSMLTSLKRGTAALAGMRIPQLVPAADRRLLDTVDFYFVPGILYYPQFFLRKPFIITMHDLQERHFPKFFSVGERLRRAATNRIVAKHARRIVCESEFVRRDIVRFLGVDSGTISVVPAPPPAAIFDFSPNQAE